MPESIRTEHHQVRVKLEQKQQQEGGNGEGGQILKKNIYEPAKNKICGSRKTRRPRQGSWSDEEACGHPADSSHPQASAGVVWSPLNPMPSRSGQLGSRKNRSSCIKSCSAVAGTTLLPSPPANFVTALRKPSWSALPLRLRTRCRFLRSSSACLCDWA